MIQDRLTGRFVIAAMVVWIVASAALFRFGPYAELSAAAGGVLPEEQFAFSASSARDCLERLGEVGRMRYVTFQVMDSFNAILTAAAFTALLGFVIQRGFPDNSKLLGVALLPAGVLGAELLENILLGHMAFSFPDSMAAVSAFASVATSTKLALGFGCIAAVLGSAIVMAVRGIARRRAS